MVNRNLIRGLDVGDDELDRDLAAAMADADSGNLAVASVDLNENAIVEGRIIRVDEEFVLVDVGYKSEGQIPRHEWDDTEEPPQIGQQLKVLIEEVDESTDIEARGLIALSKRKARKIEEWNKVMDSV